MTRRVVDPARLVRALDLEVETLGPDTYRATGGREPHTVTTDNVPWRCDCPDGAYRPGIRCKHVVAVYFAQQLAGQVLTARPVALPWGKRTANSRQSRSVSCVITATYKHAPD